MNQGKKVTLKDVAKLADVSAMTVSRVLNGKKSGIPITQETKDRVFAAAAELGYRPNLQARSTRSGKTNCIGLLLSDTRPRSPLFPYFAESIQEALGEHQQYLALSRFSQAEAKDKTSLVRLMQSMMAEGLIVHYSQHLPEEFVTALEHFSLPAVWTHSQHEFNAVYGDDFGAGEQAATHLMDLGHKRICYLNFDAASDLDHYSYSARPDGMAAAMKANGLTLQRLNPESRIELADRVTLALELLSRDDRPTAIVAFSDTTIVPVLIAAAQLGLCVPHDLSVMIFNTESEYRTIGVPVTNLWLSWQKVGRAAVRMLRQRMESNNANQESIAITWQIRDLGSTAAQ